jgi:DNA-binding SARP family transcriptional activator
MKQACGDLRGAVEDYKRTVELDPEDAVTWNNLGLLEEQLGYQEQAKERYRVSDELLGILEERGIDPETDAPAFLEKPQQPPRPNNPSPKVAFSKSFWGEIRRAVGTNDGRTELWDFIRNGFTLKG